MGDGFNNLCISCAPADISGKGLADGFFIGLWFQYWVLLIVGAITILFSTVATSNFLPLALSVGVYFGSYSSEAVYYFIRTAAGQKELGAAVKLFGNVGSCIISNIRFTVTLIMCRSTSF